MTADEADPLLAAEIRSWGEDPDAPIGNDSIYRSPDGIAAGRRFLEKVDDKTAQSIVSMLICWGVRYDQITDIDCSMAFHEMDRREMEIFNER